MRPHKVLLLAVGSLSGLLALSLTLAGALLVGIHLTQRDGDGYYASSAERYETPTYALRSEGIRLGADTDTWDWGPLRNIGTARLVAESSLGEPIFVGIARHADVERFLSASAHDELTNVSFDPFEPTYRRQTGDTPPADPARQGFWAASAVGAGPQTLTWDIEAGDWDVVVMNADARRGVSVDAAVGVKTGLLLPIGIGLLGGGFAAGAVATVLVLLAVKKEGTSAAGPLPAAQAPPIAA